MYGEKILNKKIQRLNILKGTLVSRECKDKEEIKKEIKDTVDDLELILDDINGNKIKKEEKNNEENLRNDIIDEYYEDDYLNDDNNDIDISENEDYYNEDI